MGRDATKHWVSQAFITFKEAGSSCDRASCKHCQKTSAANITRQPEHLQSCEKYYIYQRKRGFSNEATGSFERHDPGKIRSRPEGPRQTTINFSHCDYLKLLGMLLLVPAR
ncbi:hypothetical protein E4U13_007694 [Claviceps humidiphila]|uniref:Uncharacterized protein n=1 Tax=Claviceps humidiphila TaxID=1294629 RepID=A0A9P7Q3Z9_9HYPO|nr:hypothetical protein E4U13_007694 [Claviceps humidiphila]